MKRLSAALFATLALAACSDSSNPPTSPASPQQIQAPLAPVYSKGDDGIPNDYIVVFKDGVVTGPLSRASATVASLVGTPKYSYDVVLKGFAATLTPAVLAALRANPDVAYIEQDQVVEASTTQTGATWGLDRIDQRNRPLNGTYVYTSTGSGVTAYIIDTGIQTSHSQFGGRAAVAFDALGGNGQDCNGHGTHVAGTVGSATYGVAKGVALRAVRVLNCSGSGTTSGVISGMNWVASHHVAKSVANMSLGGGASSAMNTAANNLASSGVFLAVAAGNSNANACNFVAIGCGERHVGGRVDEHRRARRRSPTSAAASTSTRQARASRPRGSMAGRTRSAAPRWPARTSPAWPRSTRRRLATRPSRRSAPG